MSNRADLTGREFGCLTVRRFVGSWRDEPHLEPQRRWECDCTCGGKCVVKTNGLTRARVWHCQDCKPPRKGPDYLRDYKLYREQFTHEQRRRYEQILRGRKGTQVEAEAVDVVMRRLTDAA